jgi:GNAT superfamily N-acetyltransferase
MDEPGVVDVRIVEATVPASPTDSQAWALHGCVAVERAAAEATWGYPDLAETLPAVWAWARHQEYGRRVRLVAVAAGRAVPRAADVLGTALLELPEPDNAHLAYGWVAVRPEHRRRGVGTALAEHVETQVRAAGRRLVQTWTDHLVGAGPPPGGVGEAAALVPPTGVGRVPREAASLFAEARGYALEQAERHSELRLPAHPARLQELAAQASAAARPDYRLVTWTDAAPERWLDAYAVLHTRMSTDVPLGGLEYEEDVFDAARVRDLERTHRESGHRLLVAAAEHRPTGVLAAFTVLVVREVEPAAVFQDATLVLREHRGHRLGLLVKLANVRAVEAAFPWARRIHTWNAQENAPMLAINVAMGFTPSGVQGQWQKHLT